MEVTLQQILEAREDRVIRQQRLLAQFQCPLICFTMNIPGPVKNSPLIRRSFDYGRQLLENRLPGWLHREIRDTVTGCEAVYAADADPVLLKELCVALEDGEPVGRLFDMDVLDQDGSKLDRALVKGRSRDCIVCGAPGRGCASRRLHSAEETYAAAVKLMEDHFRLRDRDALAALAVESLLREVRVTPKPGLVDGNNNGSHPDMDPETFARSARSLEGYFAKCVRIGQETAGDPLEETFRQLRRAGTVAEETMLRATGGVNTHKGAVFIHGLLCGSLGRLWQPQEPVAALTPVTAVAAELGQICLREDFGSENSLPETAGGRFYREVGILGIRGEAAAGFPSVRDLALPVYRACLSEGRDENEAGAITLVHLIARVEDTTLYRRGGVSGAAWAREQAAALLPRPDREQILELDREFIRRNLSAGGCADLLAAAIFLHLVQEKFPPA